MTPDLSIIITTCNDADLGNTVDSIRDTAGGKPEIIVIDDCSSTPACYCFPGLESKAKIIQNTSRCGVGPSRHIGALHAKGKHILIIDAHMRFLPGWYDRIMEYSSMQREHTVYCATCLGLDEKHMDVTNPVSAYYGAKISLVGQDQLNPKKTQVLEGVWMSYLSEDDVQIQCVMGASYFCHRDWFLKLGALRFLRTWGSDEVALSLKSYLAGGDCRLMRNVSIGHRFLMKGEKSPYSTPIGHSTWNKLLILHSMFWDKEYDYLQEALQRYTDSREWNAVIDIAKRDFHIMQQERAYNRTLFVRPMQEVLRLFGL